jgi:hypothetical protein
MEDFDVDLFVKKIIKFGIAFIILLPIIFFTTTYINKKRYAEFTKDYTTLKYEDSIDNTVTEISVFKYYRMSSESVYVTLDNNNKFIINTISDSISHYNNISYKLNKGDRLLKDTNNDTIHLYNRGTDNKEILFFLKYEKHKRP